MRLGLWFGTLGAALLLVAAAPAPKGYLAQGQLPDLVALLGPPPAASSGTEAGDLATYRATRALQGTPRWALATSDADLGTPALMRDFSCALGAKFTPADAPLLARLIDRVHKEADTAAQAVKEIYKRPRPFVGDDLPICVKRDEAFARTYSYPSGHSTTSWTVAQVLAEIDPGRAEAIFARARAYGESRVVCGVHYESDVNSGRIAADAVFAALQQSPAFRDDVAQVRTELAASRKAAANRPEAAACTAEAAAIGRPVW